MPRGKILATFHTAGIGGKGTASLGVPRVKELLSFSRNIKTPIMTITMNDDIKNDEDIVNRIASHLKHTTMKDLRKKVDIYFDPNPMKKDGFMQKDNVYNTYRTFTPSKLACQTDVNGLPWLMRIELDKEKMYEKDITLLDVKTKFCDNWEKRYTDVKGLKKEEKQLLEKITACSILSNNDSNRQPVIHIRFDMSEFDFSTMISFLDVFVDNFKLKGIEGIEKISDVREERVVSFDNKNDEMTIDKHQIIYTAGVNLVDIRYVRGINLNSTIANDVVMIYESFGIEAARTALIKQFKEVFSGAGTNLNYQHLSILVDLMTNNGTLTSIDRHGFNRVETDPLARASFEKTVDQLIQAAVFGEVDKMRSVSSRIMAGLAIKGGTGLCNVILDTNLLEKSEYTEDIEQKFKKTYNELGENAIMKDVIKKEADEMFLPE